MIATLFNESGNARRVWIRLTDAERKEARLAHWLAWLLPWKCPTDLMSAELEAILCGGRPERYVELIGWREKEPV